MFLSSRVLFCVLPLSVVAAAQSPEVQQYAPRAIMLVSAQAGVEAVAPMIVTDNGAQRLEFVPVSQTKDALEHGAQPVRLADVLGLLIQQSQTIAQLQTENDRLWKVAMKDSPSQPATVVVQQPTPPPVDPETQRAALRQQLILSLLGMQNANRPQTVNMNVNVTDCSRFPALCAAK
jgi:hypothetical protein